MGRKNYNAFIKKQKEDKKRKKKLAKQQKKEEKKQRGASDSMDDMTAYVDEFGNITSERPEEKQKTREGNDDENT